MRIAILLTAVFLGGLTCAPANAEVVAASAQGFVIRLSPRIDAPADRVYRQLVDIAGWWSPAHTYSGKAGNLSLEPKAGGCWCERLDGGGSVQHMRVLRIEPGKLLVLTGALGPLQSSALTGVMTFELTPAGKSTELKFEYQVGGYFQGDLPALAKPVGDVLAEQLGRLKAAAEG